MEITVVHNFGSGVYLNVGIEFLQTKYHPQFRRALVLNLLLISVIVRWDYIR